MGIFDKIKEEAEKLMQKDPDAAQQAKQAGQDAMHNRGDLGQDMKSAQNTIKQQGGSQDPDTDPGQTGDTVDHNMDQNNMDQGQS
jgi:hypothetical protein